MASNIVKQLKFSGIFLLSTILPTVAAHGGEEEPATLSNSQVLIIASLATILVYFLVSKFLASRQSVFPSSVISLGIIYRTGSHSTWHRGFNITPWWHWGNGVDCNTYGHQIG